MTLAEFSQLGSLDKLNVLFEQGREISGRIFIFYNIKLYILSDFFVEIWYRQTTNRIDRIINLNINDVLDIYEKDIVLGDLFSK